MLQLPAPLDATQWQTFAWKSFIPRNRFERFFQRLPVLVNILNGEAHFVGVSPKAKDDVEKLPADWQKLYQRSKVGLITLADLNAEEPRSSDSLYAAEAYYAVHMSFLYDLKMVLRWLKRKLKWI